MNRRIIRALLIVTAVVLMLCGTAYADMSTNLRMETVTGSRNEPLSETYVNEAGEPVIASDKGYATVRYTYGTDRLVTRIELLDTEGGLINGAEGYARIENRYSGRKLTEQCYYDRDGNPVNGPKGYARQETRGVWTDRQSTWEYDKDGNPVNAHRITMYTRYGGYKLVTSDSWYDTNNHLTAGPEGYARVENDYIGATRIRTAYLDENGKPYYNAKAGFATLVRESIKSQETSLNYYGVNGERIQGPDGYSYALYSYRDGKYKKSMYYNADGSLWYSKKGICGIETLQNIRKKVVEEYYFTGEDQRGKSTDGYSGVLRVYNKSGILTMEKYVDENDRPMVAEELGYSKKHVTVRENKLRVREEYFDENSRPTLCAKGYSVIAQTFENGQLTETRFLDTDGKR